MSSISVIFDLPEDNVGHTLTVEALHHAAAARSGDLDVEVVRTAELAGRERIGDGILLGPGSPYEDPEAAEWVATKARREGVPLVGT